jgi:predicted RNase H-like HicB family nuclease
VRFFDRNEERNGRNATKDAPARSYTSVMADEDTVLEEAMDNLKEAGQRIRATQSLMRSQGMTDGENYRDLLTRLSTALAMTEAAYLEARRRKDL